MTLRGALTLSASGGGIKAERLVWDGSGVSGSASVTHFQHKQHGCKRLNTSCIRPSLHLSFANMALWANSPMCGSLPSFGFCANTDELQIDHNCCHTQPSLFGFNIIIIFFSENIFQMLFKPQAACEVCKYQTMRPWIPRINTNWIWWAMVLDFCSNHQTSHLFKGIVDPKIEISPFLSSPLCLCRVFSTGDKPVVAKLR